MAKLLVISVYDSAVEAYLQPAFVRSRGEAVRSFRAAVNSEGHQFQKYADDYTLFVIGTFDEESGVLEACAPQSLGNGVEYVERPQIVRQESE